MSLIETTTKKKLKQDHRARDLGQKLTELDDGSETKRLPQNQTSCPSLHLAKFRVRDGTS